MAQTPCRIAEILRRSEGRRPEAANVALMHGKMPLYIWLLFIHGFLAASIATLWGLITYAVIDYCRDRRRRLR